MDKKKIIFTGSAGFLGQAIHRAFENGYDLRLVDVVDFEANHEKMIGDVSDFAFCQRAVAGMDLLVVAHMMSRPYDRNPSRAFQVNVTGTANLFHAAMQEGIKRVCLVSSSSVSVGVDPKENLDGKPPVGSDIYSNTKACQEVIAQACHIESGIEVAVLRIGYVVDCEVKIDKYGNAFDDYVPGMIDRHDVGIVARKFLELKDLGYRAMHAYSFSEPDDYPSGISTFEFLDWRSKFELSEAESEMPA